MHGPRRGSHEPRVRAGTGDGVDGGGECRGCPPGCPPGPAAREERRGRRRVGGGSTRTPAGAEVTWTYGHLSNESLWLWYGFVPDPPVHAGTSVTFHLPRERFAADSRPSRRRRFPRRRRARGSPRARGVFDRPRRGGAPDDATNARWRSNSTRRRARVCGNRRTDVLRAGRGNRPPTRWPTRSADASWTRRRRRMTRARRRGWTPRVACGCACFRVSKTRGAIRRVRLAQVEPVVLASDGTGDGAPGTGLGKGTVTGARTGPTGTGSGTGTGKYWGGRGDARGGGARARRRRTHVPIARRFVDRRRAVDSGGVDRRRRLKDSRRVLTRRRGLPRTS